MNQKDTPLVFPLSGDESLKDLQDHLKIELAQHFKNANLEQSENCYISFQMYEFPTEMVEYLNVGAYHFYEESFRQLVSFVKGEVPKNRNADISGIDIESFVRNLVEKIVFHIDDITEIRENWDTTLEPELNTKKEEFSKAKIHPVIVKACEDFCHKLTEVKNDIYAISSNSQQLTWKQWKDCNFVGLLRQVLQSILQGLEQSLSVGLAQDVYSKSAESEKIILYDDITGIQRQKISLSTNRENFWNYLFITNIEKFFFVGGFKGGGKSRSFILFAPLYMYGQRLGYMFIIESYSDHEEQRKKIEKATEFLEEHKEHEAIFLKELKEKRLYEKIAGDLRLSNDYSDDNFFRILKQYIPLIINFTGEVQWKDAPSDSYNQVARITVIPGQAKSMVKIPLRIGKNGGGSYDELGVLEGEVHKFEGDALSKNENRQGLERAISTAAELFLLNRQIQKVAKDAEWKDTFRKLYHNIQFHLGAAIELSAQLESKASSASPNEYVPKPTEFLHDLRYLCELSRYVNEPQQYPYSREGVVVKKPEKVFLATIIKKILRMIENDIRYDNCRKLRVGKRMSDILSKAINEGRLFQVGLDESLFIYSFPDVMEVVLKDILLNATSRAVHIQSYDSGTSSPMVTISLKQDPNNPVAILAVRNECGITKDAFDLWTSENRSENTGVHNPLGILICRNFLKWLEYDVKIDPSCILEAGGRYTELIIKFPEKSSVIKSVLKGYNNAADSIG